MSYKDYTVRVFECGPKFWYLNGVLHREDGPAIEYTNGGKEWWINGKEITEQEFLSRKQRNPCDGKIVEIDGVKYKLKAL
jgi:hypothetical protein